LRIASLNLHTYQESVPLLKLEQVAYGLAALDVQAVALQEVGEHIFDPGQPNAGEVIRRHLERLTGRPWYHAWRAAHYGFEVYREGVSLLAPVPLENLREYRLSEGKFARNALAATVALPGCTLQLVSTHLSWPAGGGEEEVKRLLQALEARPSVAITATLIAGDFNATDSDSPVRRLRQAGYQDVAQQAGADGPTVGDVSGRLHTRIDYQLLKAGSEPAPLLIRACERIFNRNTLGGVYFPRVSDHVGLLGVYQPASSAVPKP
jgi:endonuclease/exonuclease/phosphatase family metal-dependent hydrolase